MQQDTATSGSDAPSVMPTIVLAAFAGGPLTSLMLWKYGMAFALVSAPLGASVAGSLAAGTIYAVRRAGGAVDGALTDALQPDGQARNRLGINATSN